MFSLKDIDSAKTFIASQMESVEKVLPLPEKISSNL
jgi:hypothetical protein